VSRAIHTTFAALAYANPPEGRTCWTTQLLANELIVRPVVPSISNGRYGGSSTNGLKTWLEEHWRIPQVRPSFVGR